jgi:hypothetical protein
MSSPTILDGRDPETEIFPLLTEAELNRAKQFARLRTVGSGDELCRPGDVAVPLFIRMSAKVGESGSWPICKGLEYSAEAYIASNKDGRRRIANKTGKQHNCRFARCDGYFLGGIVRSRHPKHRASIE